MRLDLFLKASRLIARRTLAQKFCEAGRVLVNGNTAKPAHPIKTEDEISIRSGTKLIKVRVVNLPGTRQVQSKDAVGLYETLSEEILESDLF